MIISPLENIYQECQDSPHRDHQHQDPQGCHGARGVACFVWELSPLPGAQLSQWPRLITTTTWCFNTDAITTNLCYRGLNTSIIIQIHFHFKPALVHCVLQVFLHLGLVDYVLFINHVIIVCVWGVWKIAHRLEIALWSIHRDYRRKNITTSWGWAVPSSDQLGLATSLLMCG